VVLLRTPVRQAGQNRRVRRQCHRHVGARPRETDAFTSERIERGCQTVSIPVRPETVGAERIDRDEQNVRVTRSLRHTIGTRGHARANAAAERRNGQRQQHGRLTAAVVTLSVSSPAGRYHLDSS
jgi:hypothetical protein